MNILKLAVVSIGFVATSCSHNIPEDMEVAYKSLPETIDFNFHVKPILSDRCYSCHGPDENARKADLRLDLEKEAFAKLGSGEHAFVSGNPGKSESIRRILSDDPDILMPPPDSHLSLTAKEKATIVKWIEQGAKWKDHWAFTKPKSPEVPKSPKKEWESVNEIDRFVQNALLQVDYRPSAQADKERLLRRVTMDLTGLPPTIPELDAFLADKDPNAYEKTVDRLLNSNANAERLALDWMDISRYADSHGLHADGARLMWPWRDWVIKSFKENMPYDQFVTWQLAGDLFPNATREQKLATAFNRNHPMTAEGGAIDEEFRLNYVFDRTETMGTALLGLTVACAKCHDHKFDPISQKDYYQMTAFFNNVKELGMTGDDGNYGPMLALPTPQTEQQLKKLDNAIKEKEKQLTITKKELANLETYIKALPNNFSEKGLLGRYPLNATTKSSKVYFADANTKATTSTAPKIVEGKKGKAFEFTGEYDEMHLNNIPNFEWTDKFSASLWLNTTKRITGRTQTLLGTTGDKNNFWRGWDFYLDSLNHLNARLIHSLPHNYIHMRSKDSVKTKEWRHVAFTYDGTAKAKDLILYIDGEKMASEIAFDNLYKSIKTIRSGNHEPFDTPVRVAKSYRAFTGENGNFIGRLDHIEMYSRVLTPLEIEKNAELKKQNTPKKSSVTYWVNQSPEVGKIEKDLKHLREKWLAQMMPVMEVMVMEEMPEKRPTYVYARGDYEQPTYKVAPNTPEILPKFLPDYPKNRLGLAQWIFSEDNPLSARVTVNRYWQMLFGKGLVHTPEDFGVQGALPTHPKLMDWLAVYFMESDWNVKQLLKIMVMSHTYRQSSYTSEEMRQKDPNNNYLARSNTYRLPAEMIRDNALAASGLLVKHLGGKSVKPYQPPNLWIEKSSFSHELMYYKESKGDSLYRRSMYTFIRRTQPHPAMTAFDAPSREVCTVARENTNTPLQALVLLNDTQFVEASRVLAERAQKEGGNNLDEQITYAFRLATSRKPKTEEIRLLKELFENQAEYFKNSPKEALKYVTVGNKVFDNSLNTYKTAAMTVVANTLLNHDEAYTKR